MHGRVSVAMAVLAVSACSHANRPCRAYRELAPRPPALAPVDPATAAAVEAAGARYEVCPDRQHYLVVRDGKRELSQSETLALRTGLGSVEGVAFAAIGGCRCSKIDHAWPGIVMDVREKGASPAEIARRLSAVAAQASAAEATARVQVNILTDPGPRCAADDPACGPDPNNACLERTNYDARKQRKLVYGENSREPPVAGQCSHDGECVIGGCGNRCIPTSRGTSTSTCEGRLELEHAYCGCVNTACVWFTTDQ